MALASAEKEALSLVADELGVVASWHTGARESKLNQLADKLRSIAEGNASAIVEEQKAKEAAAVEAANAAGNPQEQPAQ